MGPHYIVVYNVNLVPFYRDLFNVVLNVVFSTYSVCRCYPVYCFSKKVSLLFCTLKIYLIFDEQKQKKKTRSFAYTIKSKFNIFKRFKCLNGIKKFVLVCISLKLISSAYTYLYLLRFENDT